MSKAYQEMADGQPWDKLSENMRKTILYHHILEQVNDRLGSTMQDTTSLRLAQFTASLADVRMALGQAFLPILYKVLPYLNAMAQALYKVLQVVAAFSRSLFGGGFVYKAPKGFADVANEDAKAVEGIGDAADSAGSKSSKAAKKAAKAWKGLFGFDEVNTIKDPETPSAGGGGGGGGAGGIGGLGGLGDDLDIESPFKPFEEGIDALAKKMDKYTKPIKEAFKAAWDFIASYLGEKIGEIKAWWDEHGAMVTQAFKNVISFALPIITTIAKFIWDSVTMIIDGVINTFLGIITFLSGVFTGDWKAAWGGIKDIFWGVVEALFGFWNLTFIGGIKAVLVKFLAAGSKSLLKFVDDFKGFFSNGLSHVKTYWDKLLAGVKKIASEMKAFIDGKVELMATSFKTFWGKVETGAKVAVQFLKDVWGGIKGWFVRTVINPIVGEMNKIRDAFSQGIATGFKYLMNQVIKGINDGLRAFNRIKNGVPFGDKLPDLPTIPRLARGGITNGPTLAMVGDNAGGREVISPLDRLESMLTNSVIQAMQLGGGGNNQGGDIVLNIDGRSFARIVKPFIDREQSRVGGDVRIRTI